MIELNFTNQKDPLKYASDLFKATKKKANRSKTCAYVHGYLMPKTLRFVQINFNIKPFKKTYTGYGMYECTFKIRPNSK